MTQNNLPFPSLPAIPQTLYHYTRLPGLLGITESKSIWATDIRYLNDRSEYLDAQSIFLNVLQSRPRFAIDVNMHANGSSERISNILTNSLYDEIDRQFNSMRGVWYGWDTYTVSFSSKGDDLSQWRAYCRPAGVAIAFTGGSIYELAQAQGYRLVQCIYDYHVKQAQTEQILDRAVAQLQSIRDENASNTPREVEKIATSAMSELHLIASTFKHIAFQGEEEWRLVSTSGLPRQEKLIYTCSPHTVIPHRSFSLEATSAGRLVGASLLGCVLGPCAEPLLNQSAIEDLLKERGFINSQVNLSFAPFRDL